MKLPGGPGSGCETTLERSPNAETRRIHSLQIKTEIRRVLRAIDDTAATSLSPRLREIKIYSARFFVFSLSASPKVSLVFSPAAIPPHVSTAHSFINPKPCRPLRPHTGVYGLVQLGLRTVFVCGPVKFDPCTRRLRPFASWEIAEWRSSRLTLLQRKQITGK